MLPESLVLPKVAQLAAMACQLALSLLIMAGIRARPALFVTALLGLDLLV